MNRSFLYPREELLTQYNSFKQEATTFDFSPFVDTEVIGCADNEFQCNNTQCIPEVWRCDWDDDCGDMSDEPRDECSKSIYIFFYSMGKPVPKWVLIFDGRCHGLVVET